MSQHQQHYTSTSKSKSDLDVDSNSFHTNDGFLGAQKVIQISILQSPNYIGKMQLRITNFPFIIGRSNCDLTLTDPLISRKHLRVEYNNDKLYITDLGSKNGTFVGNERIPPQVPCPVLHKTTVRLGQNTIIDIIPL